MRVRRKLIVAAGVIALSVTGGGYYAIAQSEGTGEQSSGAEAVGTCSGGAQEQVVVRTNDAPTTINEGAPVILPSSGTGVFVAGGDSDVFVVSFSAEVEMRNASLTTASSADDSLEVSARARNANTGAIASLAPIGPVSFAGDNDREAHSATWCVRLPSTASATWVFEIQMSILDFAPLAAVQAIVDDWALHVERSN
ncbi:MAG: hypothetical protein M3127_04215 [Actinomycetota bacterium]|nr:hypothetical protein [Actinomycetota bacterium]